MDHALPVGAFHSIAAFCNAGFALFPDSFASFRGDAATLLVVALVGSAAVPVYRELVIADAIRIAAVLGVPVLVAQVAGDGCG